jgi:hypothetical protein
MIEGSTDCGGMPGKKQGENFAAFAVAVSFAQCRYLLDNVGAVPVIKHFRQVILPEFDPGHLQAGVPVNKQLFDRLVESFRR